MLFVYKTHLRYQSVTCQSKSKPRRCSCYIYCLKNKLNTSCLMLYNYIARLNNVVHNTYWLAEVLNQTDLQLRPWRSPLAQCSPGGHRTLSPQRKGGNSGTGTQAKNTNKEIFSTKWRWKSWTHTDYSCESTHVTWMKNKAAENFCLQPILLQI